MVNTYQKGARAERELVQTLNKDGNWLAYKPPRTKFGKHDIFCFDIIALPSGLSEYPMLIQLKTNRAHFYTAKSQLAAWIKENNMNIDNMIAAVFLREKPGCYRAYCLSGKDSEELYLDFRNRQYSLYRENDGK